MKIIKRNEVENLERTGYGVKKLLSHKFSKSMESSIWFETIIKPDGKFIEQWHKESEEAIYFVTSGYATVEGKEYKFEQGDLLMIEIGEKHIFRAEEKDLILLAIRFPDLPNDKFTTE